jgi:hypothetical protein
LSSGAQAGRGQRLAPVRALGHQKQVAAAGFGSLGQQVDLDHRGDVGVQRDPAFPLSFTDYLQPSAADVGVGHIQAKDLGGAQPAVEHQPRDRPVPPRAEAR